jgi:hypothetical protein
LESWEQKDHHCGNHVLPGGKKRLKEAQHGAAASSSARGQGSRGRRKGQRVIGPDPVSEHGTLVVSLSERMLRMEGAGFPEHCPWHKLKSHFLPIMISPALDCDH